MHDQAFIGRQPILDTSQQIVAYELLFRHSADARHAQIEDDVRVTVQQLGVPVRITTRLSPAWTTDWMNDAAREKLRAYGIAPPQRCAPASENVVQFAPRATLRLTTADHPACPHCGSSHTTEVSHFGSTACKALYKCLSCLEPFDYFKPY